MAAVASPCTFERQHIVRIVNVSTIAPADLDGSMTGSFDPDSNEGITAWIVGRSGDPEFLLDSLPTDGSLLHIWYGSRPAQTCIAPRWDDDAYGLLFVTTGTR
jgi:hypothetical protein